MTFAYIETATGNMLVKLDGILSVESTKSSFSSDPPFRLEVESSYKANCRGYCFHTEEARQKALTAIARGLGAVPTSIFLLGQ